MRVQSRILISQICVRNVVILVSKINGGAAAGCEQLHTTAKLSSKVELLSGSKHSMVEVQEAATARKKGFDVAIVNEVYLCTNGAAANAVGIRSPASTGVPVADQCHGDCVENPTHGEGLPPVEEPFVPALQLIISRTHGARKCMAVFKRSAEPICVFAVGTLPFLCDCRCGEKQCNDNRSG